MSSFTRLAPVALVAAVAVAGCGSKTVNTANAETQIENGLKQQLNLKQVTVSCPDDVEAKKGDTFNCKAKTQNDQATIAVTQQNDDGAIRWQLKR